MKMVTVFWLLSLTITVYAYKFESSPSQSYQQDVSTTEGADKEASSTLIEQDKDIQIFLSQMNIFVKALAHKKFEILNSFILSEEPVHCLLASSNNDHLRTSITYDLKDTFKDFHDLSDLLDDMPAMSEKYSKILYVENIYNIQESGIYYRYAGDSKSRISNYEHWQLTDGVVADSRRHQLEVEYPKFIQREKEVKFVLAIARKADLEENLPFEFFFYLRQGRWYLSGIIHPDRG